MAKKDNICKPNYIPAKPIAVFNNPPLIFIATILVSLFWLAGSFINVYQNKIAGALFEILWLPMIGLAFLLLVLSAKNWWQQKFPLKSLYLLSILLIAATVLLIICQ